MAASHQGSALKSLVALVVTAGGFRGLNQWWQDDGYRDSFSCNFRMCCLVKQGWVGKICEGGIVWWARIIC